LTGAGIGSDHIWKIFTLTRYNIKALPMLQSDLVKANPSLNVFLPIFYMVWADAVLTPSEVKTIKDLIDAQRWLRTDERELLYEQLNPSAPPSPDEFKNWLTEIRKAIDQVPVSEHPALVDIGIGLARMRGNGSTNEVSLSEARQSFANVEQTLGLIGGEAVYSFYPERRSTVTQQRGTKYTFDIDILAKLLDGNEAAIIKKVKAVISDPEFRYIDTDNLSEYREKVLQWCKHLADQGYGAMAYPKEYGGSGDMASYFAIMEALSYHDLSLVIKFGVQFGLFGMSVYFLGTEKHHKK
jgi:acyl-CoA oxidase